MSKYTYYLPLLIFFLCLAISPSYGQEVAEPLTLERAIDLALKGNPEGRIALSRIEAAEAQITQAQSAFWPQVRLSSNYTRTDNPVTAFSLSLNQRAFDLNRDFNHPQTTDNVNMRASLNLALFAGGRNIAGYQAAKAGSQAAADYSKAVCNELAFQTAKAFYTVIKSVKFVDAAQSNVRALDASYQTSNKRFNAGTALKTDVLDVTVQLAQALEELAKAQNASELAKQALANVMGLPDQMITIAETVRELPAPEISTIDNHPALKAAKAQVKAMEAALRQAKGGYFPTISAFANADRDTGFTPSDDSGESWTAGVMAELDIWNGRLTSGRVSEAEANLAAAREEERKARLNLQLELESARLGLNEAQERLRVSAQAVSQAEESAQLTQARYEQGLVTSNQLIDAENALMMVRVRRSEAEADKRISIAAVRKALGLSQLD